MDVFASLSAEDAGLVKSIGVSNFGISDLETLLIKAKYPPVVNQILFNPYVYERTKPLLAYLKGKNIVPEAYSALVCPLFLPRQLRC